MIQFSPAHLGSEKNVLGKIKKKIPCEYTFVTYVLSIRYSCAFGICLLFSPSFFDDLRSFYSHSTMRIFPP